MIETTIQDRQIVAYIEGYTERFTETHGYPPHRDDIEEVTQEAIYLYGGINPSQDDRYDKDVDELMM